MAYDVRLTLNQTNTYPSEGYVATKEDVVVEKEGRSWKNVTYTKEHGTCWKVLMGTAAFFATLGTFFIGAFLIDGIKKLWERACSGKEVVIVAIEQENLNDEQQKVATKSQEVLLATQKEEKTTQTKALEAQEDKIYTEEDLRKHFSADNTFLNTPGFIDYCLKIKNEKDPKKIEALKDNFQTVILKDQVIEPQPKFMKELLTYIGTSKEVSDYEELCQTQESFKKHTLDDIKNALSDENPLKQNEAFLQAAVDMKNSKTFISRKETIARIGPIMNTLRDHPAGEKFAMEVSELFKDLFEAQAQMEAEEYEAQRQPEANEFEEVIPSDDDFDLEEKVFDEKDLRQHFSKDNPMLNIPGFIDFCLRMKNEKDPELVEDIKKDLFSTIQNEASEMKYIHEFVTFCRNT
jgi:hypothetical protein